MSHHQYNEQLFKGLAPALPEGFSFWPDFISPQEEAELLKKITAVEFSVIEMHGVVARRRAAHFGLRYNYASRKLSPGPPLPDFLLATRARFAEKLNISPEEFPQALINEYTPGAAIGWHIDGPPYETIAGFSLAGSCTFKLKPLKKIHLRKKTPGKIPYHSSSHPVPRISWPALPDGIGSIASHPPKNCATP